jgi:hypothetical protein
LIQDSAYDPFRWLQSLDEVHFCLPVLDLAAVSLGGAPASDSAVANNGHVYAADVAAVAGHGGDMFSGRILLVTRYDEAAGVFLVNLLAPIVLDGRTGTGRQLILDGRGYPLRQTLHWDARARKFGLPC